MTIRVKEFAVMLVIASVVCFLSMFAALVFFDASNDDTVHISEAMRAGVATRSDDGKITWTLPEVRIIEVEKQVIVKVPDIQIVEVAIPRSVTMEEFKRAIIEDRHEQTMREAELNELFDTEIESTSKVDEKEVNDKVEENKRSFLRRLFSRNKKQK